MKTVTSIMKRSIAVCLIMLLVAGLVHPTVSGAKTFKKIPDGGYTVVYKKAMIDGKKLVVKGKVQNWERATNTPEYSKTGTFKLKVSPKFELLEGYRDDEESISVEQFNDYCDSPDQDHSCIAFTVEKNKVTMIRFW